MIIFTRTDVVIIAVAVGLVALTVYGIGVYTGLQIARLRTPRVHIGDMPGHPESLTASMSAREEDALDAIAARLPRRRFRFPLRGRS
ncbi:hypothetical protein [Sphaerisporangium sp. NPDC051011]|uniref:hypothetical protein n=1 Tax=Sphaerisporangium sp. NPDC051011 TaxID=3155792 RepID=UPI0033E12BBC